MRHYTHVVTKFFLVMLLVALMTLGATTAARAAPTTAQTFVTTQPINGSLPMYIDCTHIPNTPAAHKLLKAHNLCGYSSGGVTPDSTVTGNCGTLSNWISNLGGGNAQIHVQITAAWWFGPIYSISWTGNLFNQDTGSNFLAANILIGPFGFSVDDYERYHTDTGQVDFEVSNAIDTNLIGLQCTNLGPVFASAKITAL